MTKYVYPKLGRAGLANELFTYLRAIERAAAVGAYLVPPIWRRPRIGPLLRGERDKRRYYTLFTPPSVSQIIHRSYLLCIHAISPSRGQLDVIEGGVGRFDLLTMPGPWYLERLFNRVRKQPSPDLPALSYMAVHIRLGDFQPADEGKMPEKNNQSAPLSWYSRQIADLTKAAPGYPIVVCSDGTDDQLARILSMPNVRRSRGTNALADLVTLANARALIGSRSTFSALGAFLGNNPLLLPQGSNSYSPHNKTFTAAYETSIPWVSHIASLVSSEAAKVSTSKTTEPADGQDNEPS